MHKSGKIFAYPRPAFSAAQYLQFLLMLRCAYESAASDTGIADLEHPARIGISNAEA